MIILMSIVKSRCAKADILFLFGKGMCKGKLRRMQMNKATMQKNHKLLGDESGAGDDIPKSVIVRRNKKNERRIRKKAIPFRLPCGL